MFRYPRSISRRIMLVLLVAVLGLAGPCRPFLAEAAGAGDGDRLVPVVLVHGVGGSASSTWGAPDGANDQAEGIYLALMRAGYVPGRTLFTCDYEADNLGDYRALAQSYLPAAIDEARAASGASRIDIVSRSMGGLVARAYVTSKAYRGDVRTLVMIATPNRGSFGANIVYATEMINLQDQLRDRRAAYARPLAQPELPAAADPFPEFTDEVDYVRRQSGSLWEPLFAAYYAGSWLLADRTASFRAGPPDFLNWLKVNHTPIYQAVIRAQQPPVAPGYMSSGDFIGGLPGAGESLTRVFYEAIALQCARHSYFQALGGQPAEALPAAQPRGLVERIVGWIEGAAAKLFGSLFRERGQALLVWAMEHLAGLDPKAPAGDCLIEESFKLSLGGPITLPAGAATRDVAVSGAAAPTDPDLAGNYYLRAWNQADVTARAGEDGFGAVLAAWPPGVRYVSIAGQVTNLWSRLWPDVAANDLIVETSSAYLPLGENDSFHLLPSLVGTNHVWLGGSGKSLQVLLTSLREYYPIKATFSPRFTAGQSKLTEYSKTGRLRVEAYSPSYLELKLPAQGSAAIQMTVGDQSATSTVQAWAYLEVPGAGLRRYPITFARLPDGSWSGNAIAPSPGAAGSRILVGIRAKTVGNSLPPANAACDVSWRLSFLPEGLAPVAEVTAPAGEGQTGAGQGGVVQQPASGAGQVAAFPGGPGLGAAVPVIRATHRDKQTTALEPTETKHVRWEWSFGDGNQVRDTDALHTDVTVEHAYASAGRYVCSARSYAADGSVLADYQWLVEVDEAERGKPLSLQAHTVPWVKVSLELLGPAAWVTGLPAEYTLRYDVQLPPGFDRSDCQVRAYPAERFQLIWEKPGEFTVEAGVTVRLSYDAGRGRESVVNVYTVARKVEVYATVVTD